VLAFIRRYPFLTGRANADAAPGVMIDTAWSGLSETDGEPLFDAQGWPAPALQRALSFLERFEAQAQRTRQFCARLAALGLFKPMQADATLPDGQTIGVEGFQVVDEDRLRALSDAEVLELHRSGMLMLIHLHIASLAVMRQLIERKALREHRRRGASHGPQ
jgi:SapC